LAGVVMPGTTGTPASIILLRDSVFEPIAAMDDGSGPTHTSPASSTALAKSAFSEKAETWMHVAGARRAGGREEPLGHEVRLARGGRAHRDGVVGVPHVERAAVGLGVDGHRLEPEIAAGPHDAHGNLAAVRDEELLAHQSGRLPCFLGGSTSLLFSRRSSARTSRRRVVRGAMTSST
jgi:hypothetical protein